MMEYLSKIKSLGLNEQNMLDENYSAVIKYENLKSGMGVTIGNSLRRVLLSHIAGYGIRSVTISGVQHEFSVIPGLKEDVQQLIMNLKKLVFKGEISKTKANLNIVGPCVIKGSDIGCANISVVNPELYIGSLDKGFNLKLEMSLEKSTGIKLANNIKDYEIELGAIACDAFFSPIVSVNFESNTHEADGYEDLNIHIVTDGSITPHAAFEAALGMFMEQLNKHTNTNISTAPSYNQPAIKRVDVLSPNLFLRVEDLPDISTRTLRCLKLLGIVYIGDLVKVSKETLMNEPNFGENSLNKLVEKLNAMGLTLGMDIPGWPPENLATKAEEIRNNSSL